MKDATPVFVASNQEYGRGATRVLEDIRRENVPAATDDKAPVDIWWVVDGKPTAWDMKKPLDFIASHADGRLFSQIESMQAMHCEDYGFLIEEYPSQLLIGDRNPWLFEDFDKVVFSVQKAGCKILHAMHGRTAKRIAEQYRYMQKDDDDTASWRYPVPIYPASDFKGDGPVFFDKVFRSHTGVVMHYPRIGTKTAAGLVEKFGYMGTMGITEEGLQIATRNLSSVKGIGDKMIADYLEYARS